MVSVRSELDLCFVHIVNHILVPVVADRTRDAVVIGLPDKVVLAQSVSVTTSKWRYL